MSHADLLERGQGHRDRLRRKFLEGGLERFTDEEVIEFLLTLGTPRGDLKPTARAALKAFGSLAGVLGARAEDLRRIRGIGVRNVLYLKFVHQTAQRFLKDRIRARNFFESPRAVFDYLFYAMRDLKREVFKVLFLNRKHELLEDRDMFLGTLSASAVFPREVMGAALELKAAALVCVHNHPSGHPAPSDEDRRLTRDLVFSGLLLDVQVLDHLIIGHNRYYSFADEGLITSFRSEYARRLQAP